MPHEEKTHNPEQAEVTKFWKHLFARERGLLQIWTAAREENGSFTKGTIRENVFNYPDAVPQAAEWALKKAEEGREVYFCAHLLTAPKRIKENAAEVTALWGDLDGVSVPIGARAPTCVVESSPGHFHCYWGLDVPIKPEDAEKLNRALAREIGADPTGFDLTQLLRVPGTLNRKREQPHAVAVLTLKHDFHSPDELCKLLPKPEEPETNPGYETEEDAEPPVVLGPEALKVWRGEKPKMTDNGTLDRSASLLNIGRVLYDAGLNRCGIAAALKERDAALGWNKYTGRRNEDQYYSDIFDELERNGRTAKVAKIISGRTKGVEAQSEDSGFTQFTQSAKNRSEKLPEALPFPVEAMPRNCRRLIKEGAKAIGCPPDFFGSAMLATLGAGIGNSRRAQVKRGWSEGAGLYCGIIAAPGDKKTAAQNLGTKPAIKQQIKIRKKHREKLEAYKQEYREWEAKKKRANKNNEAAPPPPDPPIMERTAVGDTTIEAVARILDENPRGVGVFRDELAAWVKSMDQYKAGGKGAERQFWLSAWSNATASFDRKGEPEPTIIPRPFVGLFGSIQPSVLPDLHGDRSDGQLERFLFSYPHPLHSDWTDADISWEAEVSYSNLYLELRKLTMVSEGGEGELPEPRYIDFEKDAKECFIDLYNEHQAQRRVPGFPQVLSLVWPKLEGYLVRISLILAMSRFVSEKGPERITTSDVVNAAKLVAYFKNHAYRVYTALCGESTEDILAQDLVRFLAERGGHFRGEPAELYEAFHSRAKPKSAHWLTHHIKKFAETSHGLHFDDGHEAIQRSDTKTGKSTRRFVELCLEDFVNCVNLLDEWIAG